jgi:hypothetical protein
MLNFKMFHKSFAAFLMKIFGTPKVCRTIRRRRRKIGRNEQCPCERFEPTPGNEDVMRPKKYKNCHWAYDVARGLR